MFHEKKLILPKIFQPIVNRGSRGRPFRKWTHIFFNSQPSSLKLNRVRITLWRRRRGAGACRRRLCEGACRRWRRWRECSRAPPRRWRWRWRSRSKSVLWKMWKINSRRNETLGRFLRNNLRTLGKLLGSSWKTIKELLPLI